MNSSLNRFGFITGIILAFLGIFYIGLLVGLAAAGSLLPPPAVFQIVFSVFTLITAALMVFFWALLHQAISSEKKLFSLTSFAFTIIFCALTSINRFVALTVVPQSIAAGQTQGLEWFLPYEWPSIMLAIEILAWGFFFSLACISLAPAFFGKDGSRAVFWALIVTGILAMSSAVGQTVSSFVLSVAGPVAWGPGLTVIVILLARWFKRQNTAPKNH